MGEHLDLNQFAARTADLFGLDAAVDLGHLLESQLAGQHHRVGPLGVEAYGLGVRDVALRGDMDLLPDLSRVEDGGHVGGDDGVDAGPAGAVDDGVQVVNLILVDHRIDGQIALDAGLAGRIGDSLQVVEREVGGRCRAHVELPDPEVDGVGAGLNGCGQRFVGAHGGHDFDIGTFHQRLNICGPSVRRQIRASGGCVPRRPTACRGSTGRVRNVRRSAAP